MVDDSGDTIPPGAFLYIAERYDLIHELDEWVAKEAIKLVDREQAEGRSRARSRSTSPVSHWPTLGCWRWSNPRSSAPRSIPSRLVFEVTETAAISHMALARSLPSD